jgi:hypothetical protein
MLRCRALGERTLNGTNDQLPVIPPPKASRQQQQQLLPATKLLAGVDMSDLENDGTPTLLEFRWAACGTFRFYRSILRSISRAISA